jgi:putative inorganic carbon (HCO3(-)) transporter
VLVFWGAIVISNAAWGWLGGALRGFLDFAPVVFFYVLIRTAIDTPERLRRFAFVFVVLNVLLAVNGIVEYHTGLGLGDVRPVGLENRIRGTGIFNDPNDLGMTLVMSVPLAAWAFFDRTRPFWQRALAVLLVAPILTAIVYTNSRGAVLGMCAVVMAFALRQFKVIPALTFGAAAVSALIILGPARAQAMDSQENSAQSRIEAWGQGLMMLRSQPVFGVGYSRGAVVLVAMCDTLFRVLLRGRKLEALPAALSPAWVNGLIASAAGMLVCAFFLSRQYVVVPYILFALAGSLDGLIPAPAGGMLPPFIKPVARAVALTIVTLGTVYTMVLTMGAW